MSSGPLLSPVLAELELLPESLLLTGVDTFVRLVEAAGALIIFVGAVVALVQFLRVLPRRDPRQFVAVRLTLARFLALKPEFQLASDVLRTAIAPSFEELGKLAAVAAIRTALNYFLAREIKEEQATVAEERGGTAP
jgi:uncharacterized membrane protein